MYNRAPLSPTIMPRILEKQVAQKAKELKNKNRQHFFVEKMAAALRRSVINNLLV